MNQEEINRLQQEVNNLIERRLEKLSQMRILKDKKDILSNEVKNIEKEFEAIDKLFADKLNELKQARGG